MAPAASHAGSVLSQLIPSLTCFLMALHDLQSCTRCKMTDSYHKDPAGGVPSPPCSLQTIENTRVKDVTVIAPDDDEVDADDAQDEFAGIPRPAVQAIIRWARSVHHADLAQSTDPRRAPMSQRSWPQRYWELCYKANL